MRAAKISLLIAAAAVVLFALTAFPKRLCFDGGKSYTFYCGTSSSDCREITVNCFAAIERLKLKDVCGEAAVYDDFDLEGFLAGVGGKVIAVEELSDSVNYYCTANLPYSVKLYGTAINLHISVRGNSAKVASPIIFGGY